MLNISLLIITVSINFFLVLIILYKKRKNMDVGLLTFIFAIFFLILWSFSNFFADNASKLDTALFWTRATFPASLFLVWFTVWFSFAFPKKIFKYTIINSVYFLLSLFFIYASMSHFIIEEVELIPGVGISDVVLGEFYPFIIILYLVMTGNIVTNFLIKYKRFQGKERMQIAYVILGWAAFISSALLTNLVLPYITGNADWSKFGPLMSVIMASTTTYAIVRYRFFDIRIIIQQGLIYSILLTIIALTYLAFSYFSGFLIQKTMGLQYMISAGLTTIIGIFGIPVIKRYFDYKTDRFFFKDKYVFSEAVYSLSETLNENINLEILKKELTNKLKGLLKVKKARICLKKEVESQHIFKRISSTLWVLFSHKNLILFADEIDFFIDKTALADQEKKLAILKHFMKENEIDLFVILKINKKIIGLLALSKKLSDDQYTEEDLDLLRSLSYQMAVAIEKARLYKEIKNHTLNLEKMVSERTSTIQELQREQKQTILDISHGLQTPLTIIKGELAYLQKNIPANKSLLAFEKSIDRISKFISDLLLLAKLENMQENMERKRLNLSNLISDLAEYFEIVLENKKIKLDKNIETGLYVIGNKEKLEEAVNSLVSNSIKYIGKGKKIIISLYRHDDEAILIISDDGIGISKDEVPLLTKRFYRAKNNANVGSGLGLSICKQIVDLHDGKMEIESDLGKGTEITITLKVAK